MSRLYGLAVFSFLAGFSASATLEAAVLGKTTRGDATPKSVDVVEFAEDGTLLIGDGRGAQVFAITTEETASAAPPAKIENLPARIAERLGTTADGVEVIDLAIHPRSQRVFLAVRRQADKSQVVLTLDAAGKIAEFPLKNVTHARIALSPPGSSTSVSRVTDVAWADDRLVAAAATNEEFASKIFVVTGPLNHEAAGQLHSAETYHVSHRRWETRAPMSVIMPYRENNQTFVVGAFACTPVVKYPLDALSPGATVKGQSMIELGSGNRPIDMFTYTKDGREYVLSNTFRFHHARKPFGPSPYWTVRFERSLLGDDKHVNEQATLRLANGDQIATDRITLVEAYHGVTHMDRLGADRAVVLRLSGDNRLDLEVLPLP